MAVEGGTYKLMEEDTNSKAMQPYLGECKPMYHPQHDNFRV